MSGNVQFNTNLTGTGTGLGTKRSANGDSRAILPHEFLLSMYGRRVIVFLSYCGHELEGKLAAVDAEKGDLFLEEVTHYDGGHSKTKSGVRGVLHSFKSAMVNSRYIEMISLA
ncbi:hypothetical protein ERJ75_001180700 [Trypanosoma vivax]|uniref:LSM domain-containing protein n=1 Tax=Trypanosoma vivax (strain Y486) TaxID=1055687 RepID=G0UC10_TRYVY|nr:hypothetical protein TRVL_06098 [Trypanosoma vivax]KAH8609647.1 hypothetical protein ERJ75_001180700 [Trypanosoma vivax]CCC53358.1 hypothetical protein TVY486_1108420 [Trypanosoma vivax Y486]